tara:strand:+ start:219 stop:1106 length:888 start_codon:yes stop_codon:yes gene_type:complete
VKSQLKPLLKWAGGKSALIPDIKKYIKKFSSNLRFNRYVEPFLGSGAVFLSLVEDKEFEFKGYLLNDINQDLINLYKYVKEDPEKIIRLHKKIKNDFTKLNNYYEIRDKYNGVNKDGRKVKEYSESEKAAALMILNKTCFNGLYRVNKQGFFNVPQGKYKNPSFVNDDLIRHISGSLPNIKSITSKSFLKINYQKNDLIYFDPPYTPMSTTANFTDYASTTFGETEQIELAKKFDELDRSGKHVILSNSKTKFIKDLYSKFKNKHTVNRSGNINSKKNKRGKVEEYIILGNNFGK